METKLNRIAAFIDSLPEESMLGESKAMILTTQLDIQGGATTNSSTCENATMDCSGADNQKGCVNYNSYCANSKNSGGCFSKELAPGIVGNYSC